MLTVATYLDELNPEQRRAVEHGVRQGCTIGPPLLVIAGAGSGKTNTLAHRVAHLIVNGADPNRILLMTFSRRAATEMTRRVARIASKLGGNKSPLVSEALVWAGTFHAIGARLLREYAERIGRDPAFTIHDREDSADLMNLVRHKRGSVENREPLSCQGHLPLNLAGWATELKELFAAYVEAKQKQNAPISSSILRHRPC